MEPPYNRTETLRVSVHETAAVQCSAYSSDQQRFAKLHCTDMVNGGVEDCAPELHLSGEELTVWSSSSNSSFLESEYCTFK